MFRIQHVKKPSRLLISFSVSFIWIVSTLTSVSAGTRIVLHPEVEITSQQIHLGHIAQIQTDDENLAEKLAAVKIGRMNPSGHPRTITALDIKSRIARHRLDGRQYTFVGAKSVVRRKELIVSPEEILESASAFYRKHLTPGSADAELSIEPQTPIRPVRIPSESAKLMFVPRGKDPWRGTLELQVVNNDTVTAGPILTFQLSVIRPVVVAVLNIPRRMVIKAEHLKLERRKIENPGNLPLTKLDDAVGRTTNVTIPEGKIITASDLKRTYLVSRGSVVTIIAQRGSLKVQVSGKALENGERGQLIRLMNLTSQKEIAGEVIGNKLVRINF